jgi:CheY-like chemotaxis protein/pimeloyl-ACP methyl ester carboxylesterase
LTELLLISAADAPGIEVIFVHGINGDAKSTWNFQEQQSWHTWIQEAQPAARIWSLSYRVGFSSWRSGSMPIQDRAVNVLATLAGELSGETPILFICHSYGGLLVKQMLATVFKRAQSEYGRIAARVKGAVFLSTPHNGSYMADFVNALKFVLRSSTAVTELKANAPSLRDLDASFRTCASVSNWKIRVFFETIDTRGVRVVDENSADPHIPDVTPIGIDADHFDICKPPRPDVRITQTIRLIEEILRPPKAAASTISFYRAAAETIPLLRRYARALAGDQSVGDAFVGAILEELLDNPGLSINKSVRIFLYAKLSRLWNALSRGVGIPDLVITSELARITPLPRQAFILTALEGFTEEELAEILSIDIKRVRALVAKAGRELARDRAVKVLIIEDETFSAMNLESLVRNLGHTVIGVATTHSDAIAIARDNRPDLILSDVQLADGSSGLDAVNEIYKDAALPVIFITSYPDRFLTGERPEPAFLLAKPYQPAMVSALISQVLFLGDQAIQGSKWFHNSGW